MFKEGILNINKPSDWTSQDVCAKLRGRLHVRRIGHTGTLDPMATGVLPICIGKATRIIEYFDKDFKKYRAVMKLGIETDTLDITGEVIKESDYSNVTEQEVLDALNSFVGEIEQIPPKYSAVRVNGKRAYELAREGREVEIKSRIITISSIDNISIDLAENEIGFDVSCSKGTYIRTLCDDIGHKLGCGATMTELTRLASGCFDIDNSVKLADLIELSDDEINNLIIDADSTLSKLGSINLDRGNENAFKNGNQIENKKFEIEQDSSFENIYKVYVSDNFYGTARLENEILKPEKVIIFEDN